MLPYVAAPSKIEPIISNFRRMSVEGAGVSFTQTSLSTIVENTDPHLPTHFE